MSHTKILIVEDELLIAEMLREMLQDLGYTVLGVAKDYPAAMLLLERFHAELDLCFVDINLESAKNGFDVAEQLNSTFKVPFVFLTSYSGRETIQKAALLNPEAYLIKPFSESDLYTTVEIVQARLRKSQVQDKQVIIKDGTVSVKLAASDILWMKSDNVYVELYTKQKKYLLRISLQRLLEDIAVPEIQRTHRTYAVNLNHVHAINGQYTLVGEERIPLSRKFRDDILAIFNPQA